MKLLPHAFKTIGKICITIGAACFFGLILFFGYFHEALKGFWADKEGRMFLFYLLHVPFILGLLFMNMAREEVEDEMTAQIRLKAMAGAMYSAAVLVLASIALFPLFHLLLGSTDITFSSAPTIVTMMLFYFQLNMRQMRQKMYKELDEEPS